MIYKSVQSNAKPAAVRLEPLPDGSANVWMARNVKKVKPPVDDDESETVVMYQADIGFFNAAGVTKSGITADADGWWAFAETWERDSAEPTVEERLADMEAAVLALMED